MQKNFRKIFNYLLIIATCVLMAILIFMGLIGPDASNIERGKIEKASFQGSYTINGENLRSFDELKKLMQMNM